MNSIEVENLSKIYTLRTSKSTSIKEYFLKGYFFKSDIKKLKALDDISFSLQKGETLGIIGGNGSGKSTLLKLAAGITEPTSGRIDVNGRVAALLELGAGFHPELTGLENLYLNGAIIGIPKADLDKKKDEIFSFAELEKFIHTPVKHYSSGMSVRLGFSIAIHTNPDILLIDEVLSVGDGYFQIKSFEKIREFQKKGKSILFVTHSLDYAEAICDEIIWLDKGKILFKDSSDVVIEAFLEKLYEKKLAEQPLPFNIDSAIVAETVRLGNGRALIKKIRFLDRKGHSTRKFKTGDFFQVELTYSTIEKINSLDCSIGIATDDGKGVTLISAGGQNQFFPAPPPQNGKITITFDPLLLEPGKYLFTPEIRPLNEPLNPYDLHLRFYRFSVESDTPSPILPSINLPVKFSFSNS